MTYALLVFLILDIHKTDEFVNKVIQKVIYAKVITRYANLRNYLINAQFFGNDGKIFWSFFNGNYRKFFLQITYAI